MENLVSDGRSYFPIPSFTLRAGTAMWLLISRGSACHSQMYRERCRINLRQNVCPGIVEVGQIVLPETIDDVQYAVFVGSGAPKRECGLRTTLRTLDRESAEWPRLSALKWMKMDSLYPEERGAWLRLTLKDGRSFEKGLPLPRRTRESVSDGDLLEN